MGTQESQEPLPYGVGRISPPGKDDVGGASALPQRSESDVPRAKVLHGFGHDRYPLASLDQSQDRLPEAGTIDDVRIDNPLAIIHGTASNLKALAEGDCLLLSAEVRKASTTIIETSDRAMRILSGLRGFAREAANDPMEWASVYDIAEQSVELQEARFATHNVRMTLVLEPGIPLFLCRAVQIGQILTNLLNNAFDAITQHNCEERWISLNAFVMGGRLRIDVTDSGRGIDDETRANLMQPFFTTKTRGLGMGIGLSLSRAIAQGHGGDLSLADNTKHTSFRLSLPIEKELSDSKEMKRGAY